MELMKSDEEGQLKINTIVTNFILKTTIFKNYDLKTTIKAYFVSKNTPTSNFFGKINDISTIMVKKQCFFSKFLENVYKKPILFPETL